MQLATPDWWNEVRVRIPRRSFYVVDQKVHLPFSKHGRLEILSSFLPTDPPEDAWGCETHTIFVRCGFCLGDPTNRTQKLGVSFIVRPSPSYNTVSREVCVCVWKGPVHLS